MRHLRVVLLDPDIAGAYCGRLLGSFGAQVVIVEPTEGSHLRREGPVLTARDGTARSARWEYLAAGARSVVVDDHDDVPPPLLRWADVVVGRCDGDAEATLARDARIEETDPSIVRVVTSGFGLTGPYRNYRRSELTDWAAGGHQSLTGEPDREPLQGGGPWVSYLTGATAAIGAQAAVLHAVRTGRGQLVDVGALESVASLHQWSLTMYTHTGCVKRRWGNRFAESVHPIALYPCADGWISIVAPSYATFEALCLLIDAPELLVDPSLRANAVRFDRADEIDRPIVAWCRARTCAEAVAALQQARVPASPLRTFLDVLTEPQLDERRYWWHPDHLAPGVRMPTAPLRLDRPVAPLRAAPGVGADTAAVLAAAEHPAPRPALPQIDLGSVRMLEFSIAWAGPLAGRWLADLGVDVVMIEHQASRGVGQRSDPDPDFVRGRLPAAHVRYPVFPDAVPGERWWNRSGMFNKMNRSKRSVCMDAKSPEGRALLRGLLADADVVLHNYSPRGARSLGVDPTGVRAVNDAVVTVAMTGYGETGPLASFLSYGPVLQAHAGFDEATGYDGDGPTRLGVAFPDCVGGLHGAAAVLAGLWERGLDGRSVHADLSQFETLLAIAGEELLATAERNAPPRRRGNRSDDHSPQNVYRCLGDDRWVAVTVTGEAAWSGLVGVVGDELAAMDRADLARRRDQADVIDAAISAWTATRHPAEAAAELQAAGVPAFAVMTNGDLVEDPHVRSRGFIVTWDQTDVGPIEFPGFPIHFGELRVRLATCPGLGADNYAVLAERLGLAAGDVDRLLAAGVLADRPAEL